MKIPFIGVGLLIAFASPASAQWADNFDSYTNGLLLSAGTHGGWAGWDLTPAAAGSASNAFSRSAPNSILIGPTADAVQPGLGATSGRWVLTAWQYIPTGGHTANTWLIINNEYNHNGTKAWSCQFRCTPGTSVIDDTQGAGRVTHTPAIQYDTWAEWRLEIDLGDNHISTYYDGQLVSKGTYVTAAGAPIEIQNIDLFSEGATCYWDDLSLVQATDNFGASATVSGASTTLNIWADEPAAAGSSAGLLYSATNFPGWTLPGLVSGSIWMNPAGMIVLPSITLDASGRGSVPIPVSTFGFSLKGWFQAVALPTTGLPLLASDPVALSAGDDGSSAATLAYNGTDGRYTVTYEGSSSCTITHMPSNAVLGTVTGGGFSGLMQLSAGDSLVITETVTGVELTRATQQ